MLCLGNRFGICKTLLSFCSFSFRQDQGGHTQSTSKLPSHLFVLFPLASSPTWALPLFALAVFLFLYFIHVNIHGLCELSWLPKTAVWKRNKKARGKSNATGKIWQILPPTGIAWALCLRTPISISRKGNLIYQDEEETPLIWITWLRKKTIPWNHNFDSEYRIIVYACVHLHIYANMHVYTCMYSHTHIHMNICIYM